MRYRISLNNHVGRADNIPNAIGDLLKQVVRKGTQAEMDSLRGNMVAIAQLGVNIDAKYDISSGSPVERQ